jgi:predicted transcriptional regulator
MALIDLTAEIVAAYLEKNPVAASELPALIQTTYAALAGASEPPAAVAEPEIKATTGQIRKSLSPDALISFEDGKSYKSLKRHLSTKGLTPDDYRAKWGLPKDYPMVAPSYSAQRSSLAKSLGLGRKAAAVEPALPPAKRGRPKKAAAE